MKISTPLRIGAVTLIGSLVLAGAAHACDLCALYNSTQMAKPYDGSWRFGVSSQFTGIERVQKDGHTIDNPANEHLHSTITQFVAGYDATDYLQIQATLPYIIRRYRRLEDGVSRSGSEEGIGDLSLVVRAFPFRYSNGATNAFFQVYGGIKLPTGDPDHLKEEQEEGHEDEHGEEGEHEADSHAHAASTKVVKHAGHDHGDGPVPSIHGHDLALGSGSVDFPVGAALFTQHERALFSADIQYIMRTEGAHSYEFANDLLWSGGPGAYVWLEDGMQVALRATLSGEYKPNDPGTDDSMLNSRFMGPEILMMAGDRLSANAGVDIPLDINNSGTQAVPDYRFRLGVVYRF